MPSLTPIKHSLPPEDVRPVLLFIGTNEDRNYLHLLKEATSGTTCVARIYPSDFQFLNTLLAKEIAATKATGIITTNPALLRKLSEKPKANISDHAGSMYHIGNTPVVILNPLEQFYTVSYGQELARRHISKIIKPESFLAQTKFNWKILESESERRQYFELFKTALLIAVDIETLRDGLAIQMAGYCALFPDGTSQAVVIDTRDLDGIEWAGKFNQLPAPKIFQNGMYDNAYFIRWGIPVHNWLYDTMHMFHCWLAEMPKSLDFITAYMLQDFRYWKDESSSNFFDNAHYNAKDTWATLNCFMALIAEIPDWAKANYLIEFPLVFPCLHVALEGIAVDAAARDAIAQREQKRLDNSLKNLRDSLGEPNFNPSSPAQVKKLMHILGSKELTSSDATSMKKCATKHPLNDFFMKEIIQFREARKLLSSYLDADLLNGRFLYSLNPAGTDTGRMASKDSPFWCGGNIQNMPPEVKGMFCADGDWLLVEIDKSQAEDRCVAVLSGEPALLEIFSSGKDSHSFKGAMFFGVSYDEIRGQEAAKKRGEFQGMSLRDLAKRINHGANYNMGANVLLNTMGMEAVAKTKRLLNLPVKMSPKDCCQHLLDIYSKTFPAVKGRWYKQIINQVVTNKLLTGATGWTRKCFGNPLASKSHLNAYVAHVPQSLSVMIVNKEFFKIWRLQIANPQKFRLKAQIHDSILFQYNPKTPEIVDEINAIMQTTVSVRGSDGKTRDLFIPTDVGKGRKFWGK